VKKLAHSASLCVNVNTTPSHRGTEHLADKAYDADGLRNWLKRRKIKAVIPSTASRRTPYPIDRKAYRRRNAIERMFRRLKDFRRIATRYDRLAQNYLSGLALAAIFSAWI
jgi:transposase